LRVSVIASTELHYQGALEDAYQYDTENGSTDADHLAEAAGRICYQSWGRKNPATASNSGYLANILSQGHFSVLEHASVTFLVQDVSRALLAELSRHRHLSFSVVSQRYVDYSQTEPVIPPAVSEHGLDDLVADAYADNVKDYEWLTRELQERGLTRKQAREAARAVLPNAAPVDMVVTGNLRAWRDVLGKRHSKHADAEIQEFARLVLLKLQFIAPNSVQDIPADASE
jgi:thymidylate synthase (FAD)